MAWTKSPQSLIDLFAESLPDDPRIERRKMFGYPAIFVGGNMCAGLFQDRMFARLSDSDANALPGGAQPFEPMPGRPMRGYALIPDDILADEERLAATLAKAVSFTAALPPKEKAKKRT
ncbi:MAG TPA: TfoX/Sxy family protein [Caulobacteraceae bacterium]|nr:TfoX/Sxy family protein [Caulobacteraceae bacterium]